MTELGQAQFARGIEQRLIETGAARALPTRERGAIAEAFAGALFSLLRWWIHHDKTPSAEEMDKLFHRLASDALENNPILRIAARKAGRPGPTEKDPHA